MSSRSPRRWRRSKGGGAVLLPRLLRQDHHQGKSPSAAWSFGSFLINLQARVIDAKSNGRVSFSGDVGVKRAKGKDITWGLKRPKWWSRINKRPTQMTEQYSAYQTLAAQAAITQQLRAASDSSQVGRRSNGVTAMENSSEVVYHPIFQIVTMAQGFIVFWFYLTQQALATQVALAQYVQQVQQANQAQVR